MMHVGADQLLIDRCNLGVHVVAERCETGRLGVPHRLLRVARAGDDHGDLYDALG
jgi:hypothetical protein